MIDGRQHIQRKLLPGLTASLKLQPGNASLRAFIRTTVSFQLGPHSETKHSDCSFATQLASLQFWALVWLEYCCGFQLQANWKNPTVATAHRAFGEHSGRIVFSGLHWLCFDSPFWCFFFYVIEAHW